MSRGVRVAVDMNGTMGLDLAGAGIHDGEWRKRCGETTDASLPGLWQSPSSKGHAVLPYLITLSVTAH